MKNIKTYESFVAELQNTEKIDESILDIFRKNKDIAISWLIKNKGIVKALPWLEKFKNNKVAQLFVSNYFKAKELTKNWTDLSPLDTDENMKKFINYIVDPFRETIEGSIGATPGGVSSTKGEGGDVNISIEDAEKKLKTMFK